MAGNIKCIEQDAYVDIEEAIEVLQIQPVK
jgi:hypothetical protein